MGNVSEACRLMGYSRDTFYRVKKAYEEGGIEALKEKNRRVPNHKNRVSEEVESAVVELALENPSLGQKRVSDTLRQRGVFISPGGVRCVWLRHGLETNPTPRQAEALALARKITPGAANVDKP